MEPFEVMTSESQERMLAIVTPEGLDEVLRLCERWEVQATVVGKVTEPVDGVGAPAIVDGFDGEVLADVPAKSLHDEAPLYDRPRCRARRSGRAPPPIRPPAAGRPHRHPARPALRHHLGVLAVRPPAVPQHRRGPRAATPRSCA
jgi:phosphoribosylformylglycinamidine (FGAM) synthase-like enzyme